MPKKRSISKVENCYVNQRQGGFDAIITDSLRVKESDELDPN